MNDLNNLKNWHTILIMIHFHTSGRGFLVFFSIIPLIRVKNTLDFLGLELGVKLSCYDHKYR